LAFDVGARVVDVGKDGTRAAKNIIFENDTVVQGHVVLDLAVIPDSRLVGNKHVLTDRNIAADARASANMCEVPDTCVSANLRAGVNNRARVCEITHGARSLLRSAVTRADPYH